MGRLLLATSRSPSFTWGNTSANFQTFGKQPTSRKLLVKPVTTERICGRHVLMIFMLTLSCQGALLDGIFIIVSFILVGETFLKEKVVQVFSAG